MATGEQFPYKIVATENNNIINGFAYTFDSEATKTSINGKVDKLNRKLTFKETGIISTRTVITQAFMCLINASLELKGDVLTGRIASKQADNTACTEGTLTFRNKEELTQLFSSHDKYDQVITMGGKHKGNPVPLQENPSTISVNTVPEKITAGVEKSYDWNADSVVAEVWDGGIMDGDVVTIYAEWNKDTGNFVRGGEWIGNPEYALGIVVLSSDYRGEIIRSCTLDGKRIPLPIRNYYNIQKGAGLAIIKKLNLK